MKELICFYGSKDLDSVLATSILIASIEGYDNIHFKNSSTDYGVNYGKEVDKLYNIEKETTVFFLNVLVLVEDLLSIDQKSINTYLINARNNSVINYSKDIKFFNTHINKSYHYSASMAIFEFLTKGVRLDESVLRSLLFFTKVIEDKTSSRFKLKHTRSILSFTQHLWECLQEEYMAFEALEQFSGFISQEASSSLKRVELLTKAQLHTQQENITTLNTTVNQHHIL
ncbi:MAG: hypothetical protein M0R77_01150 [Gammaproteobacteria bacterium]|nr:hypothetical protein [Acholeplasmataceae bacterium]MCK9529163.1 hypothetical protein [Gammaproteobacteria bacterium]